MGKIRIENKADLLQITEIHNQLRKANALKLSYSALTKKPGS